MDMSNDDTPQKRAYRKYYDRVRKDPDLYTITYAKNNKKRYEKIMNDPVLKKQRDEDIRKWHEKNPEKLREYRRRYNEKVKKRKEEKENETKG